MLWLKPFVLIGSAAAWTIEKGAVAVSGSGDTVDRTPFEKLDGPVELFGGRSLDIGFKIPEEPLPHQVAVRLSHVDANGAPEQDPKYLDKIVLAKMRGNNAKVVISYKSIPEELLNYPLKAIALISGSGSDPLEAPLFDLFIFGNNEDKIAPFRKIGAGESLRGKPDIFHQFRGAPRHANPIYAVVFILAIDTMFAGLLISWKQSVKPNLKFLTSNPGHLAVISIIALIELTFVGYYVSWSIFELLTYSAVLLPLLSLALNRAL